MGIIGGGGNGGGFVPGFSPAFLPDPADLGIATSIGLAIVGTAISGIAIADWLVIFPAVLSDVDPCGASNSGIGLLSMRV